MFRNQEEVEKLINVARMYYDDGLTQNDIAKVLHVSRPLVSKMLAKARDLGIVTITIKSPLENNDIVADKLASLYGLKGAFVVPEARTDYLTEQLILAQVNTIVIEELQQAKNIGLGWGFLMEAFVKQFPEGKVRLKRGEKKTVVPLIGGATVPNRGYNPNEIVRSFSEKLGIDAAYLFAPAFPLTAGDRESFISTQNYREIDGIWDKLDLAVLRITNYPCTPDQATATRFGDALMKKRAVGAVLSSFYNERGEFIEGENDYCISIGMEKLKQVDSVIGICSNYSSIPAIIGALRSGVFTHVVLDEEKALKAIASA